jgi:hypothetical protein
MMAHGFDIEGTTWRASAPRPRSGGACAQGNGQSEWMVTITDAGRQALAG